MWHYYHDKETYWKGTSGLGGLKKLGCPRTTTGWDKVEQALAIEQPRTAVPHSFWQYLRKLFS
jgi:hypothetical protein